MGGARPARRRWLLLLLLPALALAVFATGPLLRVLLSGGIERAADSRGLAVSWSTLDVAWPLEARLRGLVVTRRGEADTLVRAESLAVRIDPWSLVTLRPRPASLTLVHAAIRPRARRGADPDTLVPDAMAAKDRRRDPARAERVRSLARTLVRALEAPAHNLPRLAFLDVSIAAERTALAARTDDPEVGVHIAWLELSPDRDGVRLAATGRWLSRTPLPFAATLHYGRDDRISGDARLEVPSPGRREPDALRIAVDGALEQARGAGRVVIADTTRLTIGQLQFRLGGEAAREGPRFRFALTADTLTARQWQLSLPRAVLGPLLDLSVRGWYGWRLVLDLDFEHPDSVAFTADVLPHGLRLDSLYTRLNLLELDRPFVAEIHLPRDRIVLRELSPGNPHYRPFAAIDSLLVHAVVTNEDGAFFRHRGFNTEAVRGAIADNVKAGAFRRGAGTITMQLVRNLYLGHARTLSRKGQEVVLAWVLEHLTGLPKERILEIYLNIIEWGPETHGADEATHYYFGHDAGRVTVDEALFLATVVPAPSRWHYRFDATGALRPFARAQMHFIGRAMIARGRLAADRLPPADSLRVELKGPARAVLLPPGETPGEPSMEHPAETHADTTAS